MGRPPNVETLENGVNAVFPTDSEGGGTWIGANESGLGLFLLNNYQGSIRTEHDVLTRGALIPALLQARAAVEFDELFAAQRSNIDRMRPFNLFAVWQDEPMLRCFRWSGQEISVDHKPLPVVAVSSSVLFEEADLHRRASLALNSPGEWTNEQLDHAFASHHPAKGPTSVCMHRDDATTVSHSRVWISGDHVRLGYWTGPLCESPGYFERSLTRS